MVTKMEELIEQITTMLKHQHMKILLESVPSISLAESAFEGLGETWQFSLLLVMPFACLIWFYHRVERWILMSTRFLFTWSAKLWIADDQLLDTTGC